MVKPKRNYLRFIVLKYDSMLHRGYSWIVCDLLNDKITYHSSKQCAYQFIQANKRFFDGWFDITEEKDDE